ncbi:hypothetical protein DM860_008645 [Cuscuta australis]|uniref:Uncharacterized protein n=1 Tax=Cuscuta australis TaxID=267555 RepID=A0A328D576_9ASTE|nr:hypothetical protein DM860_008645 [Cuscuta australis]
MRMRKKRKRSEEEESAEEEEKKNRQRRRRRRGELGNRGFDTQIMKLLEGESIAWSEQENGRTLVIKVDEINPKMLSFFKRPSTSVL